MKANLRTTNTPLAGSWRLGDQKSWRQSSDLLQLVAGNLYRVQQASTLLLVNSSINVPPRQDQQAQKPQRHAAPVHGNQALPDADMKATTPRIRAYQWPLILLCGPLARQKGLCV